MSSNRIYLNNCKNYWKNIAISQKTRRIGHNKTSAVINLNIRMSPGGLRSYLSQVRVWLTSHR